jgi:hypothetical protein
MKNSEFILSDIIHKCLGKHFQELWITSEYEECNFLGCGTV